MVVSATRQANVAGLDVGFALSRRTSGVAMMQGGAVSVSREFGAHHACAPILAEAPFDVIAIDGPIVPAGQDVLAPRAVERLFASGAFQRRCKPGFSHVTGTGRMLREAAGAAADALSNAAPLGRALCTFPQVRAGGVVEAFPNAFLGVCLSEEAYQDMPSLRRGGKFDWLYEEWINRQIVTRLPFLLSAEAKDLHGRFAATNDHDERAALVCLLTALAVARGDFTAVGEPTGGWFFLPPWRVWEPWARAAVDAGVDRLHRTGAALRVERIGPSAHAPTEW